MYNNDLGSADISGIGDGTVKGAIITKVSKSGDTMTGHLQLGATGSHDLAIHFNDYNGNTLRHKVWMGTANNSGTFYLWDNTLTKAIITQGVSGNATFDGINVKDMLTPKETTLSKSSYSYLYGDVNIKKCGGAVSIYIYGFKNLSATAEYTVVSGGIPSEYRPSRDLIWILSDSSVNYKIKVTSGGSIVVYCYGTPTLQNNFTQVLAYVK